MIGEIGLRIIGYDKDMRFKDYNVTTIAHKPNDISYYHDYTIDDGKGFDDLHISIGE